MKISEAIKILEVAQELWGDLKLGLFNDEFGAYDLVGTIEIKEARKSEESKLTSDDKRLGDKFVAFKAIQGWVKPREGDQG